MSETGETPSGGERNDMCIRAADTSFQATSGHQTRVSGLCSLHYLRNTNHTLGKPGFASGFVFRPQFPKQ